MAGKTLYDKLWDAHIVRQNEDGTCLLYVDRHLVHEVTSPQAFEGLRLASRRPWRVDANLATADHNVPTTDRAQGIVDAVSRLQVETLDANCRDLGITEFGMNDPRQGIVHVIGPEQGRNASRHDRGLRRFAYLHPRRVRRAGFRYRHLRSRARARDAVPDPEEVKNMRVRVEENISPGVTAKDIVLAIIGRIGIAGGSGYAVEFAGNAIEQLSVEGRMTVCNMAIEAGARAGMIAVDEKTIEYFRGRPYAPKGAMWDRAVQVWREFKSDADAKFDKEIVLNAADIRPQVTWGTSPEMVVSVDAVVPDPEQETDAIKRGGLQRALKYMGLAPGTPIREITLDKIFIGSCTNSRIEDLRCRGGRQEPTHCQKHQACLGRARFRFGKDAGGEGRVG